MSSVFSPAALPCVMPAAGRRVVAWRNGGGVTTQIAVWPDGAGMDSFDWRISMAEVAQAGPFSVFDGVDRVLTVLSGSLLLRRAGAAPVLCAPGGAPVAFGGDVDCVGVPLAGAVTDLNVMTRRGRARAGVRYASGRVQAPAALCFVFALCGCAVRLAEETFVLEQYDALRLVDATDFTLSATALVVGIDPF